MHPLHTNPFLELTISYITEVKGKCQATVNTDVCAVNAAVVEYPVTVTNTTLVLAYSQLRSGLRTISTYESAGDSLAAPDGTGVGPLNGLHGFLNAFFYDNATIRFNNRSARWLYSGPGPGQLADIFFQAEPWDYSNHSLSSCGLWWANPKEHIFTAMYDFMFRVALRVGRDTDRQPFDVTKTTTVMIFRSDWRYLGAALAVMVMGLLLVGSFSWDWWKLERAVTLSPLETASLFVTDGSGSITIRDVVRPGAAIDEILQRARRADTRMYENRREEQGW